MFSHFGKIFGRLKRKMCGDYGDEEDGKDVRGNTDRKRFLSLHSYEHLSVEVAIRIIKVYKHCAHFFTLQVH